MNCIFIAAAFYKKKHYYKKLQFKLQINKLYAIDAIKSMQIVNRRHRVHSV